MSRRTAAEALADLLAGPEERRRAETERDLDELQRGER